MDSGNVLDSPARIPTAVGGGEVEDTWEQDGAHDLVVVEGKD